MGNYSANNPKESQICNFKSAKPSLNNNNNNNNNFISIALLSYVQGALQSCKQHYWKIFTNLLPYPNIFTMDKKGKIETKTTIKPYS